jgi:hypothetical protein
MLPHRLWGLGMVTKQLSIALAVCLCVSFGITRPGPKALVVTSTIETKIDFDQVFADATRQGVTGVNRAHKGDRLPNVKAALREPPMLPNCEPVASPYADPILGRIVGRCAA